jgi:SAM-dependent methyltransferase
MANERFEGLYGRLYTHVIQSPRLRRALFSLWGSADPILRLDAIVAEAAAGASGGTILDVPCGGGTLLPLLARSGFRGAVIEADLAGAMMRRALATQARLAPPFEVSFVQGDARELALDGESVDAVISLNGLHVIPEPERFLAELHRVLRPGGSFWLITPVTASGARSRVILAAAGALRITPAPPPSLARLHALVADAGFEVRRSLGGTSITGLLAQRTHSIS